MNRLFVVPSVLLLWALAAGMASAQSYPSKPLRLIMPYPPGGATDIIGRLVAQRIAPALGQPVVVDNRAGASALVGTEAAAKSSPDGYTLVMLTSTNAINQTLHPKLPYDLTRDFDPVAFVSRAVQMLAIHPSIPARSVRELTALARSRDGQLSYASSGQGTSGHLAMEVFKRAAGVNLLHVPYRGGAPALNDVLGGQVAAMFGNVVALLPHVKSGKLRSLAVSSAKRSVLAPDLPTIAESGFPGFEVVAWFGIAVPAGTPKEVSARLNAEIGAALRGPEARDRLLSLGAEPAADIASVDAFAAFLRTDIERWAKMLRDTGVRPE